MIIFTQMLITLSKAILHSSKADQKHTWSQLKVAWSHRYFRKSKKRQNYHTQTKIVLYITCNRRVLPEIGI